jgi:hypothetical protein
MLKKLGILTGIFATSAILAFCETSAELTSIQTAVSGQLTSILAIVVTVALAVVGIWGLVAGWHKLKSIMTKA